MEKHLIKKMIELYECTFRHPLIILKYSKRVFEIFKYFFQIEKRGK